MWPHIQATVLPENAAVNLPQCTLGSEDATLNLGVFCVFVLPSDKGLHVQSSFSGSLRKAGALFRKDTVRVTSSPALRRT